MDIKKQPIQITRFETLFYIFLSKETVEIFLISKSTTILYNLLCTSNREKLVFSIYA